MATMGDGLSDLVDFRSPADEPAPESIHAFDDEPNEATEYHARGRCCLELTLEVREV